MAQAAQSETNLFKRGERVRFKKDTTIRNFGIAQWARWNRKQPVIVGHRFAARRYACTFTYPEVVLVQFDGGATQSFTEAYLERVAS